jgi:hypothetical protein
MDETATPHPLLMLRLRAIVLALGESASPPWWKTTFFTTPGFGILERLFPRTSLKAAVHAAGKGAGGVHDRAAGKAGVYHLFRLPETLEIELHRFHPSPSDEFFSALRGALSRPDALAPLLASLCRGEVAAAKQGAVRLGPESLLMTTAGIGKTAAAYQAAFAANKPCYPYFAAEIDGGR